MIHIGIKTGFSFLKGYGSPEQIISRTKEIGAPCFGIADISSTWAHISFSKAAKKAGLKMLFGVQLPIVSTLDKDPRHDLVTMVAKTTQGIKDQYEAVSLASEQFYYRGRLTWKQLSDFSENNFIIANRLSPDTNAEFMALGKGWIGVAPEPGYLLSRATAHPHKTLADCSPLYPRAADLETWRLLVSIGSARKTFDIDTIDRWIFHQSELLARFDEVRISRALSDAWIYAAEELASQCDASIPTAENVKPKTNISLEEWCKRGAIHRGIDLSAEPWRSRYDYEIRLIYEKGFVDYFLLIADLVAWAKETMLVGPARGSSAGSLVCWLMGIVEVNPIKHNLMFERFIDVTRTDLPDVDIDFPDDARDSVYTYLADKYGPERVARLGTISVFKSKSAISDVAKSYSVPKWEVDELSSLLIERSGGDARSNMTIMDTIEQFDKAKALVEKYPKIAMAANIEGHPRHSGKHAAGVCISNNAISNYCSTDAHKGNIGMLTKYDAETIGLMKIDALGLKTLSVISDCCQMAGYDDKDLYNVELDYAPAYKIFKDDRVAGVFQFEGYAVRSLMRQMGVEHFNDITALTSLARPGPLHCGGANEFIARRIGAKDWEYSHPSMVAHTSHTYGTIVYQEQVMSITRDLGGMDWQDVNALRRAMSKSLGEEFFNTYRSKFLVGTQKKEIPDNVALQIWEDMCTFGSWAFNLSHAVSYAMLSYWCAYLKAKFPLEFAVANLRRSASDDSVFRLLRELDKEGYPIIPFDPEMSDANWSAKNGNIYGGFTSVKGVGEKTAATLIEKREADPKNWLNKLTLAQRSRILAPNNTPWHNLKRLSTKFSNLYADPDNYRSPEIPGGISGPVVKIEDITEHAGEYCFIATIKVRNLRDLNETQSLAKRNGRVMHYNNLFLNLQVEDDTGAILCTVNRYKYATVGKVLMEEESDGCDFLIRGTVREEGRRKIDIIRMVKLQ